MRAIKPILESNRDYEINLLHRSRLIQKQDELNGTSSEDIAKKVFETLIKKSNEHHPTVVSVLRKVIARESMHKCKKCFKYMKNDRKHNCIETMKLCQLAQTWPRLNKKLVCLLGCQRYFSNYKELAKHYLKEHNWLDLK